MDRGVWHGHPSCSWAACTSSLPPHPGDAAIEHRAIAQDWWNSPRDLAQLCSRAQMKWVCSLGAKRGLQLLLTHLAESDAEASVCRHAHLLQAAADSLLALYSTPAKQNKQIALQHWVATVFKGSALVSRKPHRCWQVGSAALVSPLQAAVLPGQCNHE